MTTQKKSSIDGDVQSTFDKFGLEGIKKHLEEYKKTRVYIAVTGQSGCGKSSFINRLRGLTPMDRESPQYAKIGVTETTTETTEYEFPDNPLIQICDLPGAGTATFPIDTYAEDMNFDQYHAFVILTKDRFYEKDKRIAEMVQASSKPFFFARTKMDATMKDEADDKLEDFIPLKTERKVRRNCQNQLVDKQADIFLLAKENSMKIEVKKKGEIQIKFPDNERLKKCILDSLEDLQRTALGNLPSWSTLKIKVYLGSIWRGTVLALNLVDKKLFNTKPDIDMIYRVRHML
jgi:GTP-binding protein EngB required for normal cell division